MILIKAHIGGASTTKNGSLAYTLFDLSGDDRTITVEAKSTRLFDVCNAFVDAAINVQPNSISAIDAAVFGLIKSGAIPQVPKLVRGEIVEFIQKIAFALSSVSRLQSCVNYTRGQ